MVLGKELIAVFNPFLMPSFYCPVCGSKEFVELIPNGGVWCNNCNAEFFCKSTCDGITKIAVSCKTDNIHKDIGYYITYDVRHTLEKIGFVSPFYWTVICEGDVEIRWFCKKNGKVGQVALENNKIVVS